ncbi:IclR family transcriptional regulator [Arthrobacter sp. 7Tela_A1]|uniref:IclR family transcriptional regulator n=1 Tax=Arthrobacter sp. 7Tela_A1 TaxID=3093745 RepID=UPI003BB683C3
MTPNTARTKGTSGAETGRKLLNVLGLFTGARPAWTVAELARELGLTTSTAYRYVGLLREEGFLEPATDNAYRVTARVLDLAGAHTASRTDIVDIAVPVMTRLRDEIGETVLIARRAGDFAYCVERVESEQAVRLQFRRGQAMSLHSGSIPRTLLAYMPPRERERYVASVEGQLNSEAHRRLLSAEALDELARAGHTESFEEIDPEIWGCAAAVHAPGGEVLALGTAGPTYRLSAESRRRIQSLITGAARQITDALAVAG